MSTFVYMKMLEQTPHSYDRGMRILTAGRIDRIKREITTSWVGAGQEVLEIGCGTGTLASMLSQRGARVVGIDVSDSMLAVARANAPDAELLHMTAVEIDTLGPDRFDCVVATLSLSELSEEEMSHALRATADVLKPGGRLVVADEVRPRRWWKRALASLVRWFLAALTFVLTRSTTRALDGLEARLAGLGMKPVHRETYLLGTLALVVMEKA
ncbi:MAG: corrinoid protein-associated methyltransferase CpaM [Thermoanaerobaculales bacterium]